MTPRSWKVTFVYLQDLTFLVIDISQFQRNSLQLRSVQLPGWRPHITHDNYLAYTLYLCYGASAVQTTLSQDENSNVIL